MCTRGCAPPRALPTHAACTINPTAGYACATFGPGGHAEYLRTGFEGVLDRASAALLQAQRALEVAVKSNRPPGELEQLEAVVAVAEGRVSRANVLLIAQDAAGGVVVVGAGNVPTSNISTVRWSHLRRRTSCVPRDPAHASP